ncbi:MAG TPA: hypothetical protein DCL77_14375 [Prolixibacteraceae bacterium]|jgi:hypothetical protein|nr:hypothetical protein [Prolixibacteraceae bacterium]
MLKDFMKLKAIVLKTLGVEGFAKNAEGKEEMTAEQKVILQAALGEGFADKFAAGLGLSAQLEEQEVEAAAAIQALREKNGAELQLMTEQFNAEQLRANGLAAQVETLKETVDALAEMPDTSAAQVITPAGKKIAMVAGGAGGAGAVIAWNGIKADRKLFHNQMAFEYIEEGNSAKAIVAKETASFNFGAVNAKAGTINTTELVTEFGEYMSQFKIELEIKKMLTQATESQNFMTTKMAIKSWKASKAVITSVVQQFVAKWTPLGSSTFTPIEIINRRHKVNLPITPDDITDSWLTYLYNEAVTPDKMPITRYIIEQLLRPKIADDIELSLIATGVFEELGAVTEGQAGQATGKSMDGYLTILKAIRDRAGNKGNFYVLPVGIDAIDKDNIVDVMEDFAKYVKDIAPKYHAKGMDLLIDPQLEEMFQFKYRDMFPATKNEDGRRQGPDFSKLTFRPLEAMRGSGMFFCTPKDNFIRLININEAGSATNLSLQVLNYDVKVFAEFWLACGFSLEELIFAYVPVEASGSGA